MSDSWKPGHIVPDLREDHLGSDLADTGDGCQVLGPVAKGLDHRSHLRVDCCDRFVERIDLSQVELQEEAMTGPDPSTQSLDQALTVSLEPARRYREQGLGPGFAGDQRLEDRPTACAGDVADDRGDLKVGIFQGLLDALNVLGSLADELLARAHEGPQFLDWGRRDKARTNQAVREQVGDPGRVVDIRLASRDVLDVHGVGKHQLEVLFEDMPYAPPVDP